MLNFESFFPPIVFAITLMNVEIVKIFSNPLFEAIRWYNMHMGQYL